MTVVDALEGHAKHAFKAHVYGLLRDRGLNVTQFLNQVYGKQAISNFYPVLSGVTTLTPDNAKRWADALGASEESLLAAYRPLGKIVADKRKKNRATLRHAVLELLGQRNLTVADLARAVGHKTSGPVSAIIAGRVPLSPTMAERIAKVLGVTPDNLTRLSQSNKKRSGGVTIYPVTNLSEEEVVADALAPREGGASASERFSLVVNGDGTAEVRLHLQKLPIERALKLVASPELRELLSPELRLKLTHDGGGKRSAET